MIDEVRTALADSSKNPADRISAAIRLVIKKLDLAAGAMWTADADGTLKCRVFAATVPVQVFEYQTKSMHFPPGTGLPGRVAKNQRVEWVADVTRDDNFPRMRGALRENLRGAVAFPIGDGSGPLGAIELFSHAALTANDGIEGQLVAVGKEFAQQADIARFLRG